MSNLLAKELKRSKYRLLGLVGQGQFGRVYCAIHRKTGRLVALKDLDRHRFPTHKFLRELRFLLSLQHPNIVTCHALEHTLTGRYLVMDYCEGGTFRNLLEDVQIHPAQGLKLLIDVLAGLHHAHQRGIVHCDIKPENVLLRLTLDGWVACLTDFGIARLSQEMANTDSGNTGSPAYMAPERFYGQSSPASDLYAVGIMLFELLVGHRPFSGLPADLMSAHLNRPLQIPATLPEPLQQVIAKALQKLPGRRYRSAAEMMQALQEATQASLPLLCQGWVGAMVLQSLLPPVSEFQTVRQQRLMNAVQQVISSRRAIADEPPPSSGLRYEPAATSAAVSDTLLHCVVDSRVSCHIYPGGVVPETETASIAPLCCAAVRLPDAIVGLSVRPQGCFAVTERAVYFLSHQLFRADTAQHGQKRLQQPTAIAASAHAVPQLVTAFDSNFIVTIAADGRRMATATQPLDPTESQLALWRLQPLQPFQPTASCCIPLPFQVLMLTSSHVAVASRLPSPAAPWGKTTRIDVMTRRATRVGSLTLPVPLQLLVETPTPYRLIGVEPSQVSSVVIIDLKPLRMQRFGVGIIPKFVISSTWGLILMDEQGEIVLMNSYGEVVGRMLGPAHATAIAAVDPHGLIIATWYQGVGKLYTIDLRQLDLDLVF